MNLSPHYAYGWLWNLEGPRQIFLHDIEVVGERRKGIGRLMIQTFIEAGKRLEAEELVAIPVTSDGVEFLNGVFRPAEPVDVCDRFCMPLAQAAARVAALADCG